MEIKINLERVQKLLDSDVTGYEIYQYTGINQSVLSRARNQNIPIEEMKFKNVMLLDQFAKQKGVK